ncbi:MAG: glutamate--cysteine ligase [Paucimonas sp.]|jgi:gamma-glutamyl:cysteine ligase YbdK (ATP-grasp superfamily)|nr:glutamate--cysteine ligase [Paucimonas sp.]
MSTPALDVFMGYGIELEYAIVNRATLECIPLADVLLDQPGSGSSGEVRRGMLGWSNELVNHVIEIKNLRPNASLAVLPSLFQGEVNHINRLLQAHGAQLMPTAMHPWMNPVEETVLWPHDEHGIYGTYQRIFDTRTHGWANLQSMHVNLPFDGDRQFERLHAAVRLVLPIIPALAASSPFADGHDTGFSDFRMETYRTNAGSYSAIAGDVIPETVTSRADYEARILEPMYKAVSVADPAQVLRNEWLNSRGAIARFERNAIEIRVIDTQECPKADLSVAAAVIATTRWLYCCDRVPLAAQQQIDTAALAKIFLDCVKDGERAVITDRDYLGLLGYRSERCTAQQLWRHIIAALPEDDPLHARVWRDHLYLILESGPLSRRIRKAAGNNPDRRHLQLVYDQLCECLEKGKAFDPS